MPNVEGESWKLNSTPTCCTDDPTDFDVAKGSRLLILNSTTYSFCTGLAGFQAEKYLKKIGLGKEDHHFWKQVGKALVCTYALFGAVWFLNETSPFGWWTLKPMPKEEKELAHLYERREFPYPGDEEAMEEFVAKGGMIGTSIGPKGMIETDKDSYNYQKDLQDKKLDQEALKLWMRMRNEVVSELQEKGFDVE